ncbi:MAG: 1-acyl-sn-glycerol-3-phosphate acyltransferase [Nitrospirota bacterium]|nr:MAG: 1-acyl-sn-glycerol-3-phosphate acyltransferase [Nitrospirota bacterium]
MYNLFRELLRIFYKLLFRFEVSGRDNIPKEGGVIVASNHLSFLDPPFVGMAIKRRATFMAHSGLFRIPLLGKFVSSFSIPVDRHNPKPSTVKEAVRILRKGGLIVIFPEGTRSSTGSIGEEKRGAASIAALSGAAVVPARIEGTEKALPVGARFIRPKKIRITFGEPITRRADESGKDYQNRLSENLLEIIKNLRFS